ncbi:hypothetical protein [Kordiimonas gwangyangensis]|uniref:hypothetical protein n=1 Tax=Kordiimonas gwangyangensis TaxID=288022 RepID=UPI00036F0317|nr:hypothetical protein [Kordiimonas gwangyangensis]
MKIYLHIGTHKTGTTSIQHFAEDNIDLLAEHGIYWPRTRELKNTSRQHSLLWRMLQAGEEAKVADFVARAIARAQKEGAHSILFSGEGFCHASEAESASFMKLLDGHDVEVIVYFRNVFDYARSAFTQNLKYASRRPRPEILHRAIQRSLDYTAIIELWQKVVPGGAVEVRSYDEEKKELVPAFFDRLGVPAALVASKLKPSANQSIDPTIHMLLASVGSDDTGGDFGRSRDAYFQSFKGPGIQSPMVWDIVASLCVGADAKMAHPLLAPFREWLLKAPDKPNRPSTAEQAAYFASLAKFSRRMVRRKRFEASALFPLWLRLKGKRRPT